MASIEGFGWVLRGLGKGEFGGRRGRNEDEGYDYGVGWKWCRAWLGDICDIMSKSNEENFLLALGALYYIYLNYVIIIIIGQEKKKKCYIIKIIPLKGPLPRLPPPPAILTVQCLLHKRCSAHCTAAQPWRRRINEPEEREYYFGENSL